MSNNTEAKIQRLAHANELIKIIAAHGRGRLIVMASIGYHSRYIQPHHSRL